MTRIVRLTFHDQFVNDFIIFFNERKMLIRSVKGCNALELWQDQHEPNIFYTYSIWEEEIYLNTYRESEFFQSTWSVVKNWFKEKPWAFSASSMLTM